jgi:NTE family protein
MAKAGLVFGGGGGKGAYQAGVWAALESLGLCPKIEGVAGASVGALNAAMFAAGNLALARAAWGGVSEEAVLKQNKHSYDGWFSNDGLRELLQGYVDYDAISASRIPCYTVASKIKAPGWLYGLVQRYSAGSLTHKLVSAAFILVLKLTAKPRSFDMREHPGGAMEQLLLASSAIPLVFPDIEFGGDVFVDGGLVDNEPVLPLYEAGFRKLIVVSLGSDYEIPREKFPEAEFLDLSIGKGSALLSLAGTFDFTAQDAKARMKQGYDDCLAKSDSIYKFLA